MANNIMLDEGASGKYTETEEITTGIHRQAVKIAGVGAAALRQTRAVAQLVTCSSASADYTVTNALAATTKYITVYCASVCIVAMGEATSATCGVAVGAGMPTTFPVVRTGVTATDRLHVQSPVAGAVVRVTEMAD